MGAANKLGKYLRIIYDRDERFKFLRRHYMLNSMPDDEFLRRCFRAFMHRELNLENPETFSEKIQWLKLYDRRPEYTAMADKVAAKNHIEKLIGGEYVIPVLGVWDSFDEIDFEQLPKQFVLKCSHDCGSIVICTDKYKFDRGAAREKINRALRQNYYYLSREWVYKDIKPRIIAEAYIDGGEHGLVDYKVHCFDGQPKVILLCRDRFPDGGTQDFYTEKWEHLDVRKLGHPNAAEEIAPPVQLQEMLELARRLSLGTSYLRVDFYIAKAKLYLGEMTFYHAGGYARFDPDCFDCQLGDMLTLPKEKITG